MLTMFFERRRVVKKSQRERIKKNKKQVFNTWKNTSFPAPVITIKEVLMWKTW